MTKKNEGSSLVACFLLLISFSIGLLCMYFIKSDDHKIDLSSVHIACRYNNDALEQNLSVHSRYIGLDTDKDNSGIYLVDYEWPSGGQMYCYQTLK